MAAALGIVEFSEYLFKRKFKTFYFGNCTEMRVQERKTLFVIHLDNFCWPCEQLAFLLNTLSQISVISRVKLSQIFLKIHLVTCNDLLSVRILLYHLDLRLVVVYATTTCVSLIYMKIHLYCMYECIPIIVFCSVHIVPRKEAGGQWMQSYFIDRMHMIKSGELWFLFIWLLQLFGF